jgi:hypothetical protein
MNARAFFIAVVLRWWFLARDRRMVGARVASEDAARAGGPLFEVEKALRVKKMARRDFARAARERFDARGRRKRFNIIATKHRASSF